MKGRKTTKYRVLSKVLLKTAPIVNWRGDRKFSQERAADFAGVSLPVWKRAEYGLHIQLASAARIAEAIGIPREQLVVVEERQSA